MTTNDNRMVQFATGVTLFVAVACSAALAIGGTVLILRTMWSLV